MNWGKREHRWENYTFWLTLWSFIGAVAWIRLHWDWLAYTCTILALIIFVVHTVARIFHLLEKRYYRYHPSPRNPSYRIRL